MHLSETFRIVFGLSSKDLVIVLNDKHYSLLCNKQFLNLCKEAHSLKIIISCNIHNFIDGELSFSLITSLNKLGLKIFLTKLNLKSTVAVDNWEYIIVEQPNELSLFESKKEFIHPDCISINSFTNEYIENVLASFDINKEIEKIKYTNNPVEVTPNLVPQFSSFEDVLKVGKLLSLLGDVGPTFDKMGYFLREKGTLISLKKYGENHSKCCELFDFVSITCQVPRRIYLTPLGEFYFQSEDTKAKEKVLAHQILRMPVIRNLIINLNSSRLTYEDFLVQCGLSIKTAVRRRPNLITIYSQLGCKL